MGRSIAGLVALVALAGNCLAQGKLAQVREAINKPQDDEQPQTRPQANDPSATTDDGFDFGFHLLFASPWLAPYDSFDAGMKFDGRFARYPFANPDTGFILIDHDDRDRRRDGLPTFLNRKDVSPWSVRASAEQGSDFDGLLRTGLRLFLDTSSRFGLRTDWDFYTEHLVQGRRDELWLSDVTTTYRFVQNEFMQMHTGLGVRMMLDRGNDHVGWNFLYSVDVFHTKPFHAGASFEMGGLNGSWLWRLRAEGGVNYRHLQLIGGYDFFRIGRVNLHGPFVGVRLWF